jgi:hypothetical protein
MVEHPHGHEEDTGSNPAASRIRLWLMVLISGPAAELLPVFKMSSTGLLIWIPREILPGVFKKIQWEAERKNEMTYMF